MAISHTGDIRTLRTQTHRLVVHTDGQYELDDHTSPEKETKNIAPENSELVKQLRKLPRQLDQRLPRVRDR